MYGNSAGTGTSSSANGYYDSITNPTNNVYVVGDVGKPNTQIVRIVHISDTHEHHNDYINKIPFGHILIHSGDFGHYSLSRHFFKDRDFHRQIDSVNSFFSKLPHEYKIFVAGNHEMSFDRHSVDHIQSLFTSAIYLQDTSCTLYGLKIYGLPWNRLRGSSFARGYARDWGFVCDRWAEIPEDTDVLVSHIPPWNRDLYPNVSKRVKPILHLFGHEHNNYGIKWKDKILFSNAAMAVNNSRRLQRSEGSGSRPSTATSSSSGSVRAANSPRAHGHRSPIVFDVYVNSDNFKTILPAGFSSMRSDLEIVSKDTLSEADEEQREISLAPVTQVRQSFKCTIS